MIPALQVGEDVTRTHNVTLDTPLLNEADHLNDV